jgi:hypothetical protein
MNPFLIVAGIVILLILLYYALNSYFSNDTVFRIMPNQPTVIPATEIKNGHSDAFTYVMLIRIDKRTEGSYTILDRQSEIKLYIDNGSLKVATYTIDASGNLKAELKSPQHVLMEQFPFNRWVHMAISIGRTIDVDDANKYTGHADEMSRDPLATTNPAINSIMDFYIDGKLLKSVSIPYHKLYYRQWPLYDTALDPVVDIADDKPLTIGLVSDTESGYENPMNATIAGMKRWDHVATVQEVGEEYNSTMRTRKLFGDYGLDLRLYNGSSLASRFSVI